MTIPTLILVVCGTASLFSFAVGFWTLYDQRQWQKQRGWVVSSERLALLKEVEANADRWNEFKDAPPYDPRFSYGRRVADLIEEQKLKAANLASILERRNQELNAQRRRADELLEEIDDLHRERDLSGDDGLDGWTLGSTSILPFGLPESARGRVEYTGQTYRPPVFTWRVEDDSL